MNLQELKKQLPHGAISLIAKRAGVTITMVSLVLSGKVSKCSKIAEIITEAAKIAEEHKAKMREAEQALQKALNA